jgi:hypothetical protein
MKFRKKSRLLLSALIVLAIFGGALASRARTTSIFYSSHSIDGKCSVTYPTTLTTNTVGFGETFRTSLWTTTLNIPCPEIAVRRTL